MEEALKAKFKEGALEAKQFLVCELIALQTGRANTQMIEGLSVDSYGSMVPLKQLASLSVVDPRTIVISPWDKGNLGGIEKAVAESGLGFSSNNDGSVVRVSVPQLTEERRLQLAKLVGKSLEEAKISLRNHRREMMEAVESKFKNKEIGEDEKIRFSKELQELFDSENKGLEEIAGKKEAEIKSI